MKRTLIGALAISSLLLGTMSPASADVTVGAGAGTGGDYVDPEVPVPCGVNPLAGFVRDRTYTLEVDHVGTYSGVDTDTGAPVVYVGDSHVTVDNTEDFFFSPLGTHDPGSTVDPLGTCLVPAPIDIEATVTGSSLTGNMSCVAGEGTYTRVQSAVVIEFTSQCTINGVGGPAEGEVTHVMEGELTPCFFPPFDENNPNPACTVPPFPQPPPASIYVGTYQAAGAT